MDAQRFTEAYERLELLDSRATHRIRPRGGMQSPGTEQLAEQVRELQSYSIELKEILRELFAAIAGRPQPPGGG